MKLLRHLLFAGIVLALLAPQIHAQRPDSAAAEQLFAMANQTRARAGLGRLQWDHDLAVAALKHCMRMVSEGQLSHRYGGEPDLTERAATAGAHFSLIEENIALGPDATTIHRGWLESPPHRANLLAKGIDRVGIAVVSARGNLWAVADYGHGVAVFSPSQAEAKVADLLRMSGLKVLDDPAQARAACALDHGLPRSGGPEPLYVMRWQNSDLNHLPQELVNRLSSREYRRAAVGSCTPRNVDGPFTVYRMAVLLYGPAGNGK